LIVDDEPLVLSGMKRALRSKQLEVDYAASGFEALEKLKTRPFDIIVTDLRMPEMNGLELLETVSQKFPGVVRVILSGEIEQNRIVKSAGHAHRFLAKPTDIEQLCDTIRVALAFKDLLGNPHLGEIVFGPNALPSLPLVYHEIMAELRLENASLKRVGELISQDIAMTAKILQLVNSAFFGLPRHISDPIQAARLLGLDIMKGLITTTQVFGTFAQIKADYLSIEHLTRHSILVARVAKKIATETKLDRVATDDAFVACMLHDVGKLILAQNLPDEYGKVVQSADRDKLELWQAEQREFGTTHAELGAYLLGIWGLPTAIVEAVLLHHRKEKVTIADASVAGIVQIANAISSETGGIAKRLKPPLEQLTVEEYGIAEHYERWRALLQEMSAEAESKMGEAG
jgi:putative nucleotidyltransferase with HDIG domain